MSVTVSLSFSVTVTVKNSDTVGVPAMICVTAESGGGAGACSSVPASAVCVGAATWGCSTGVEVVSSMGTMFVQREDALVDVDVGTGSPMMSVMVVPAGGVSSGAGAGCSG